MMIISLIAFISASLFVGAAFYISLVEHPARLALTDGPSLEQWQTSYKRALPMQSGLAALGGFAGIVTGYMLMDWRWAAGGAALLANWPYTLAIIMPLNMSTGAQS